MTRKPVLAVVCLLSLVFAVGVQGQEPPVEAEPEAPVTQAGPAVSAVNVLRLIRFSGTARGAQGQPLAGVVGVTFALYENQEGGAPLWLEMQNASLDRQGRYTALLGSTSNDGLPLEVFSSGEARWLGITVQGQPEQPRILLVSVPYALKAAEAETLSGRTASDFVLSEQLTTQVEEEINTQIESQGLVTTEEAANLAQVTGSGTAGQIAKFVTPTEVGDSVITEANGRIGIGFATPVQKLVIGAAGGRMLNVSNLANQDLEIRLSTRLAADRHALIAPTTPTNLALGVGGDEKMRITNAGNVGIGTPTPSERLEVEGDFKVNSQTGGLVIKGNATSPNIIGGFSDNIVLGGVVGATIGGGGKTGVANENQVAADYGTVGGGSGNTAGSEATVAGGFGNTANASRSTVGGGLQNTASGESATVGGGQNNSAGSFAATVGGGSNNTATSGAATTVGGGSLNTATGLLATVGGGTNNVASGSHSTVPGGQSNGASGDFSFAAGRRAKANNSGSFVWGDSTDADFLSERIDQFRVRAGGGARFDVTGNDFVDIRDDTTNLINTSTGAVLTIGGVWTDSSDVALKEHFAPADPEEVLARLVEVPMQHWNYKAEGPTIHRLGPTAQDFYAAFGLGTDDKHIGSVDAHGVAFAAIQALYHLSQKKDEQFRRQQAQIQEQQALLQELQAELARVKAQLNRTHDNQLAALRLPE